MGEGHRKRGQHLGCVLDLGGGILRGAPSDWGASRKRGVGTGREEEEVGDKSLEVRQK